MQQALSLAPPTNIPFRSASIVHQGIHLSAATLIRWANMRSHNRAILSKSTNRSLKTWKIWRWGIATSFKWAIISSKCKCQSWIATACRINSQAWPRYQARHRIPAAHDANNSTISTSWAVKIQPEITATLSQRLQHRIIMSPRATARIEARNGSAIWSTPTRKNVKRKRMPALTSSARC